MSSSRTDVATRALKDPAFAQQILEGKENYPELKEAIMAEMVKSRDAIMSTLPDDQRAFMAQFLKNGDPANNPKLLQTFINLRSPAGSLLVSRGAHMSAASW